MPNPKMLILRGNWAPAGNYPDEKGNTNVAWPLGALHVQAASDYARMRVYERNPTAWAALSDVTGR